MEQKTIIIVVSIGSRFRLLSRSLPRITRYASKFGYSVGLITSAIQPSHLPAHYAKLCAPQHFPGFERYCIIDDDILISETSPPLPCLPSGRVGLVRDVVQENTENTIVGWTGNTGFVLLDKAGIDLLIEACNHGDEPSVWGFADQGALNYILWKNSRIVEIDHRWNFAPTVDYFHLTPTIGWERWRKDRLLRIWFFLNMALNPFFRTRRKMQNMWGVHLIRTPYTGLFDYLFKN